MLEPSVACMGNDNCLRVSMTARLLKSEETLHAEEVLNSEEALISGKVKL